ncbi:ATP-dependent DNA helicase chl1 [Lithohypha guttulata]|uniref:ATP-dependent DNA helicase chl1 n=1 Tax=Lithohypha guttulata TaxID=1690604 RepID=UPI002DE0E651|nr:ATP-dependent DNA helicase chl1 [Lithohypha guttulata]
MKPSHHKFHHPYEPYNIQADFMLNLYQCIEDGNVGIFESPTGTGKSLSLICAALTWLRDDERRRIFGDQGDESELDWLEQAEMKARRQQLLDTHMDLEEKLNTIRLRNAKDQSRKHAAKRVKIDETIEEQDLVLEDYESDSEIGNNKLGGDQSLSSTTRALLEQLKPVKSAQEDVREEDRTKVIFCSRTHSQLTQFVNELRKISISSGASQDKREKEIVKHLALGSRKNLCINLKVAGLSSTTAINERCLDLQKPGTAQDQKCKYLLSKVFSEDSERLEDFKNNVIARIQDIEDIANLGRKMSICPYYAARSVISAAEVLTLPYPLLLQRNAREALGVAVKDNIVVIDEAHNLASAIADTLSVVVPLTHLELAHKQVLGYCQKFRNKLKGKNRVYIAQIVRLLKACITRLQQAKESRTTETSLLANELISASGTDQIQPHKLVKYIQESKLVYKIEGYAVLLEQQSGQQLNVRGSEQNAPQPKGVLAEFQNLLIALTNPTSEGRFFITQNAMEVALKYTLLDPQAHFEDIVKEARAVILAGGTMSPMNEWSEQLFPYVKIDKLQTYSFGHIIDKGNVLVQPLSRGSTGDEFDFTFNNRRNKRMINDLSFLVERICTIAPDGMVVFFPSYEYLAFITDTWKIATEAGSPFSRIGTLKQIFQESKEVNVDELLTEYSNAINTGKGALMLAVVGGKLSEGINFSDKLGRVVVCVGLPYPNIKSAEWKAKVEYIERLKYDRSKAEGASDSGCKAKAQAAGKEYADNIAMRAVNQSIGRAIRHRSDYAAIYLIDKRYATSKIQSRLPAWLRSSMRESEKLWPQVEQECNQFFAKKTQGSLQRI